MLKGNSLLHHAHIPNLEAAIGRCCAFGFHPFTLLG